MPDDEVFSAPLTSPTCSTGEAMGFFNVNNGAPFSIQDLGATPVRGEWASGHQAAH